MKKQARDIAKTSNGKVVLVAADELKVTSSFYGSIFAEKEKINGKTEYSKIPISLLEVGGSKKNVTFYLMWIRQNIYMNLPNHLGIVVTVHAKKMKLRS